MGIIEELEENKSFDEAQSVSEVFEEEEMREENESDLLDQDAEKEDQQREEGEEDSMDSYTQIVMKLYNEYVKECKEPEAMEEVPRKAIEMALKETQEEYEMHVMEGVEEQGNEVEFVTVVDGFQESLEKFVKYGKTDRKWSYMRRSIIAYFKVDQLFS
ncbi:unnamed protein product [Cylicostephanus goldi]|uniref:Uncharacterized protein n=1 Tax=Cylicostephanus goldi TaxID=71465 RepID=A0A3P6QML5_CYLGO|nr:unnamed protein product [Cylicostephanus goldi]